MLAFPFAGLNFEYELTDTCLTVFSSLTKLSCHFAHMYQLQQHRCQISVLLIVVVLVVVVVVVVVVLVVMVVVVVVVVVAVVVVMHYCFF